MEVNPGASPFRCIDLTCCKAVAIEEARRRQSSPSADAGRPRVLYRLPAMHNVASGSAVQAVRPAIRHSPRLALFACALTA